MSPFSLCGVLCYDCLADETAGCIQGLLGLLEVLFGDREGPLEVTPLKYLMGDFGGAGVLRAAAILLGLSHRQALPTVTIKTLKGSNGPVVWNTAPSGKTGTALMTSSTFGGASASLVFTRV